VRGGERELGGDRRVRCRERHGEREDEQRQRRTEVGALGVPRSTGSPSVGLRGSIGRYSSGAWRLGDCRPVRRVAGRTQFRCG
jgi:hypothetical protein